MQSTIRLYTWCCIITLFGITNHLGKAQEMMPPLYFIDDGYVYQWTRITGHQIISEQDFFTSDITTSRAGTQLAYIRQQRNEPRLNGYVVGNNSPAQRNEICIWEAGLADCFTSASHIFYDLQWLADGRLTWIEFEPENPDADTNDALIIFYDVQAKERTVLENVRLKVGDAGMSGFLTYMSFQDAIFVTSNYDYPNLYLYDKLSGERLFPYFTPQFLNNDELLTRAIVIDDDSRTLYILHCGAKWYRLDVEQSKWHEPILTPTIDPVLKSNTQDSISIHLEDYDCRDQHRSYWNIYSSDGQLITSRELGRLSNIRWQISPDGQYVAYLERDTGQTTVWYNNQWHQIDGVTDATDMVWGQVNWYKLNISY